MQNENLKEFKDRRVADIEAHTFIHDILLDIQKDATEIKDRVISIETKQDTANTAFSKNDLGMVDYEGHRRDHLGIRKAELNMDKYKFEFTKSLLKWGVTAIAALLFSGFLHRIATGIGIPGV